MASAKATIDHDEIRGWVEARGGHPAHVKQSGDDADPGILRVDYPGFSGQGTLERISWDEFFEAFDANNLAFLYQDESDSRFSKLVDRGTVGVSGGGASRKSAAKRGSARRAGTSPVIRSRIERAAITGRGRKSASSSKKRSASSSRKRSASSSKKRSSAKASSSKKRSASSSKKRSSAKKASSSKKRGSSSRKASSSKKSSKRRTSGRTVTASSSSTSRSAITTTNHDEIRKWVESRGGFPAHVKRTGGRKDPGVLRIDYSGFSGKQTLERMSWDEWFNWFDRDQLAFLYQKKANSRFSKLVRR